MIPSLVPLKVAHCDICQRQRRKLDIARPELHPVPVKSPWYHLGIDFVGPISPQSDEGNRYILTLTDYFTKFACARAVPSKEAVVVVRTLQDIFYTFGIPAVITTDQGSEFKNQMNSALTEELGIKHRLTSCYHPQANGLDERFNQTLIHCLSKYVSRSRREDWDIHLQAAVHAYNTAVQESTKHTPFEAMFGRLPRLPVDLNHLEDHSPEEAIQELDAAPSPDAHEVIAKRQAMEERVSSVNFAYMYTMSCIAVTSHMHTSNIL